VSRTELPGNPVQAVSMRLAGGGDPDQRHAMHSDPQHRARRPGPPIVMGHHFVSASSSVSIIVP
jgi:hypothetical protein